MKTTYLLLFDLILALTFRTAQAGDNDSAVREGRLSLDEVTNIVLANNPASEVARRALRLDPAESVYGSEFRSPAGSSDFRKKSKSGTSSDGRSRHRFRGFSPDTTRCTLARPRGLSSAGQRICAARSKPTQRRSAQSIRRSKPPALRSWQRQSGRCAHGADRRGQAARSAVRYFPPDFRRAIAAQRADESASAVAARSAISGSISTTALFIAGAASCRLERTTGNAASSKPGRSRKIPR